MSSSSGGATSGRPPQIGRNSINMPGFNDFDVRVTRNVPIHDKIYMHFNAEAFNLLNHQIVTGVNSTYTTFLAPGASATVSRHSKVHMRTVTPPAGSRETGCFVPLHGYWAFSIRSDLKHQQQLTSTARANCRFRRSCFSSAFSLHVLAWGSQARWPLLPVSITRGSE
jgi:hypothetical protein